MDSRELPGKWSVRGLQKSSQLFRPIIANHARPIFDLERKGKEGRTTTTATAMFKPRLRIPRGSGLRMSFQPSASQPSSPFAVAAAAAKHQQQQQQRSIHATPARRKQSIPALNDDGKFSKEGVPGLYTPQGFNAAYSMYQTWCLDRLNELTGGTSATNLRAKRQDSTRCWLVLDNMSICCLEPDPSSLLGNPS